MKKKIPPFFQETFEWLQLIGPVNKKFIYGGLGILLALAIPIIRFQMKPDPIVFAKAEALFQRWKNSSQDEHLLSDLQRVIHPIPELRQKYEPAIVHQMMKQRHPAHLIEQAEKTIALIENDVPFHADFSATTLTIAHEEYQQALEQAVHLKQKMLTEWGIEKLRQPHLFGGSILFIENLIRIAHLQQELKNQPGEKAAWDEVQTLLKEPIPAARAILERFHSQGIDLQSYIAVRQKSLEPR